MTIKLIDWICFTFEVWTIYNSSVLVVNVSVIYCDLFKNHFYWFLFLFYWFEENYVLVHLDWSVTITRLDNFHSQSFCILIPFAVMVSEINSVMIIICLIHNNMNKVSMVYCNYQPHYQHRPHTPLFKSWPIYGWRVFHLSICLVTFRGYLAHSVYCPHS